MLLEGKSKTPEDFIIRQLYYPYRRFTNLDSSKKIIPVFFTFDSSKQTYNYWVYEFLDDLNYNSLKLINTYSYTIQTVDEIVTDDLYPVDSIYKDLVPQADKLEKVQELIFKVKEGIHNARDMAEYFGFDKRQSSYYREAAEALGFVKLLNNKYYLTDSGRYLTSLDIQERNLYFSRVIINFNIIRISLDTLKQKRSLTMQDLNILIEQNSNLTGTTVGRRASTLHAWLKWIAYHTGAITIDSTGKLTAN